MSEQTRREQVLHATLQAFLRWHEGQADALLAHAADLAYQALAETVHIGCNQCGAPIEAMTINRLRYGIEELVNRSRDLYREDLCGGCQMKRAVEACQSAARLCRPLPDSSDTPLHDEDEPTAQDRRDEQAESNWGRK